MMGSKSYPLHGGAGGLEDDAVFDAGHSKLTKSCRMRVNGQEWQPATNYRIKDVGTHGQFGLVVLELPDVRDEPHGFDRIGRDRTSHGYVGQVCTILSGSGDL